MNSKIVRDKLPFILLILISIASIFVPVLPNFDDKQAVYNGADITWILIATALVFLMTPGLAFFYGGMVHRKNVISTMIKSTVAAGVVSVIWVAFGYSLCFGDSLGGFVGNPLTHFFFKDVSNGEPWGLAPTIPKSLFALFQLMFAIITPGLVVGALAERVRFTSYILFIILFSILVYAPLAHWSWHPDGFLFKLGALDFAGGTVVHISAGCAALAGVLVLKRRKAHLEGAEVPPANVPYVLIGTGLLWFGWFGFNAGSALGANGLAVSAFATTNTAAAAAGLVSFTFAVSLESGDSYRFSVSSMTASVNSNTFVINPFALAIATQPSSVVQYPNSASSVETGTVVVHLKDGSGNTLTGSSSDSRTMSVALKENSGNHYDSNDETHPDVIFHICLKD